MAFALLYWKWIAGALVVAALVGYYNIRVNGLIKDSVTEAVTERDKSWRDAEQKAIEKADAAARAKETAWAKDLAVVKSNYDKDITNAKTQRDKDVAAARSGAIRLRFATPSPSPCNDPKAPATAGRSDGPATTELPAAITGDLLTLANDADAIVRQLTACQAVIISDRKETP